MATILISSTPAYLFCSASDGDKSHLTSYDNAETAINNYIKLSYPLLRNYDNTSNLQDLNNSKNEMLGAVYELSREDRMTLKNKYSEVLPAETIDNAAYEKTLNAIRLHASMEKKLSSNYSNTSNAILELNNLKLKMVQAYNDLPQSLQTELRKNHPEGIAHCKEFI
jgi:hypothetical protein